MIVSDSTVLITLININEFSILQAFVKTVIIPYEVYQEVTQKAYAKNDLEKQIEQGFVMVEKYKDTSLFNTIHTTLDSGESAAITLALEKELPLIIDEKKGRKYAKEKGIEIVGLVGILRFLYLENKMSKSEVVKIVDALKKSDFRISNSLLNMILSKP